MNKHWIHIRNFKDGNTHPALNDYEYDLNDFQVKDFEKVFGEESERSSMILDRNKGIESIHYNHLNLPTRVNFTNNKHISYKYNAAGQKLQKTVNYSDSIKIVDYLDGFQTEAGGSRIPYLTIKKHDEQYAGEVLQFFPHTEGYVKVTALSAGRGLPTSDFAFNYVFNYTDHLGNVRLSYTKDPQTGTLDILDENHYYPFGLKHGVYVASNLKDFTLNGDIDTPILEQVRKTEYQYKYNGKELQDELGLNWYDYGARNYDATIGRWMNVDLLAEQMRRHSPYNYAFNNPVFFIDPDGMMATPPLDYYNDNGNRIGTDGVDDGRKAVVTNASEIRAIKRADRNGGTTTLGDVGSAVVLPNDGVLQESLNVLDRTTNNGGLSEESSIVMNDGTVLQGERGEAVQFGTDAYAGATLPNLPEGTTPADAAATIHSHPTAAEAIGEQVYSSSALAPSIGANKDSATFSQYGTNIIVGRLGLSTGTTGTDGQISITQPANGIVIYNNGGTTPSLQLSPRAVGRIIANGN
jgi:RHS repeat-associated protein